MKKNVCLLLGTASVFTSLLPSCKEKEQKQPNILFAIADDWTWKHSSFNDYPEISTPHFDRVASEGIYFERAYCNVPSCAPSRATILTGKNGWELDEGANLWGFLPERFPVYTDLLRKNGYFVGYTGKGWAPGDLKDSGREKNPAGKPYKTMLNNPDKKIWSFNNGILNIDYAANFKAFLEDKPEGQPFSFWYGGFEPHRGYDYGIGKRSGKNPDNLIVPEFFPDDSVARNDMLDYLWEVEWFDKHLGKMLKILEERGELENTLVVVTSDNGMPFPRCKANLYEFGTHMPLAMMWKAEVKEGRQVRDFVNFIDFAPTFLDAAGVNIPESMNGRSLMPLLLSSESGQIDPERDRTITYKERHAWVQPEGDIAPFRALRKDDWLLIWNLKPDMWPAGHIDPQYNYCSCPFGDVDQSPTKSQILKLAQQGDSTHYRMAFMKRPEYELYHIEKDPYQLNNLAEDPQYQEILDALRRDLKEYLNQTNDPRMKGKGSVFVEAPYYGTFR